MFKSFLKNNLIYINSALILLLIIFFVVNYIGSSCNKDKSIDKSYSTYSWYFLESLQNDIYKNIDETATYVVWITSSKNVKFYMEDPSLLQWPGTAIERNSKLDEASWILLNKKWYILTNKHVVENLEAKYAVVLYDGTTYDVDKVRTDKQLDLAILKINIKESDLEKKDIYLPNFLDSKDEVKLGSLLLALGKKWENDNMLWMWVLSSKNRELKINNENLYVNMYQVNFLLQPWFSWSPLVDMNWNVVAINTAIDQTNWESFALPISNELIFSTIKSIEKYGNMTRWLVWIKYDEISNNVDLQKKYNLTGGIFVKDVLVDLPAFNAGIQVNDIILSVNGIFIDTKSPFLYQIYKYLPWDELKLQILRNWILLEISLILWENS